MSVKGRGATGDPVGAGWLAPAPGATRRLIVPSPAEFEALLAEHGSMARLRDLRQTVVTWKAIAESLECDFEHGWQLGAYRLRVERALGSKLAREVRRGGIRTGLVPPDACAVGRLPKGVSKQQAARYRKLAALPEQSFQHYLMLTKSRRQIPTAAGARRHGLSATSTPTRQGQHHVPAPARGAPPEVLDMVGRIMSPDVCVGSSTPRSKLHLRSTDRAALDKLGGDVFVAHCPDPDRWLQRLAGLHRTGMVHQALVTIDGSLWADWFRAAVDDGWAFSFVHADPAASHRGTALAHFGARRAAFVTASAVDGHACVSQA